MTNLRSDLSNGLETLLRTGINKIWVACSGGVDSMVLAYELRQLLCEEPEVELGLLHINYGFRGLESQADSDFVLRFAIGNQLPYRIVTVSEVERQSRTGKSLQEWARDYRFRVFREHIDRQSVVAVGHHEDDLVETTIQRLARGTSGRGMIGMQVLSRGVWRPLLAANRKQILQWAARQKIHYREDSSNAKLLYSRNRIRHRVVPELEELYPGSSSRIVRLAKEIDDVYGYLHSRVLNEVDAWQSVSGAWLRELPRGVAIEAISRFLHMRAKESEFIDPAKSWTSFPRQVFHEIVTRLDDVQLRHLPWSQRLPNLGLVIINRDELQYKSQRHLPFGVRWKQHRRNLTNDQVDLLLPPFSKIFIALDGLQDIPISFENLADETKKIHYYKVVGKEWDSLCTEHPQAIDTEFIFGGFLVAVDEVPCFLVSRLGHIVTISPGVEEVKCVLSTDRNNHFLGASL